jgi:hypothetical protein
MARTATLIGKAKDAWGDMWDVRESRPTAHGFDILIGWPEGLRGKGFGGPRAIATPQLLAYMELHSLDRDGSIYDLPVGRTTVRRLRRLMGMNYYEASYDWWIERMPDLALMDGVEFARLHGVHGAAVSIWRKELLGEKRLRDPFWWKEDPAKSLLLSGYPSAYIADRLEIAASTVRVLRRKLKEATNDNRRKN